jgi:hypothetical protein
MAITQVVGTVGLAWAAILLVNRGGAAAIGIVALTAGLMGIVSFVRHSIFHRSDAARMKWDLGRRNDFQIEVGLANLAWGLFALVSVLWGWGTAAQATATGIFGLYLASASTLVFSASREPGQRRSLGPAISTAVIGLLLLAFAIAALVDASIAPFG